MIVDYDKIRVFTTAARPERKQNEIYEIILDGKKYWCERPKYCWSRFDQNLYGSTWKKEGNILFGEDIPIFFDQHGRLWCREELTSKFLLNFFTKNPLQFVKVMSRRLSNMKKIISLIKEAHKQIHAADLATNRENMEKIVVCFDLFYDTQASVFMLYDELVFRFKHVLQTVLEKREANTYFCEFLRAEITKEALRLGHIQEFGTESRGSTYGNAEPVIFYKEPKIFYESPMDISIFEKVIKANISQEQKDEFFALRLIAPIAIQINEEAQYVESRILTAHFRVVMENIAALLLESKMIKKKEEIHEMTYSELLYILKKIQNKVTTWVPQFLSNALKTVGFMEFGTLQPWGWLEFEPLFAEQYVEKVELLMHKAEEQHVSIKELATLWPTTGGLRCQLFFLFGILKAARIEKERRMKICNFFFAMMKERAVADVHGTVSNVTKTKEEVKAVVDQIQPKRGTPEIAKLLGKISNAAYNLVAGLYLDIYLDYGMENEGPYDVSYIYGPGHILVIRKYVGLQSAVWPKAQVPVNDLLIYCIYKDVKFSCDMASCHSVYEGDVINNLVAFAVVADDRVLTEIKKIQAALKSLTTVCVEQWNRLKSLPEEEQKKKGLFIKTYGMRKLFERVGMNWKPTNEMIAAVKNQPLKDNTFWKIPKENKEAFWENIYNPEIDFYPGDLLSS